MSYVVRYEQLIPRKAFRATHGRIMIESFADAMNVAHKRAKKFMNRDLPSARHPFLIRKKDGYTVVSRDKSNKEYESAVFTVVERS